MSIKKINKSQSMNLWHIKMWYKYISHFTPILRFIPSLYNITIIMHYFKLVGVKIINLIVNHTVLCLSSKPIRQYHKEMFKKPATAGYRLLFLLLLLCLGWIFTDRVWWQFFELNGHPKCSWIFEVVYN